jgi:hypothetical protein
LASARFDVSAVDDDLLAGRPERGKIVLEIAGAVG